jgi:metallopeptidase MepB
MSTGERLYPAAAMVMNLPHPTDTRPPLLLHDQLRRLFHELGHAMHSMLSKTKCARFHGPPGYDRDFAEAVSMMFENFLWIPEHMANISLHYSYLSPKYLEAWHRSNPGASPPPRHLSEDMIDNMIRAKDMGGAIDELTKIWHSKFDMAIHSPETPEELANLDLQVLWNQSMVEITGLKGPESEDEAFTWASGFSAFRAPVSGYDAGYYTYILSRFISDDLFYTGFREDTMNSERGARYRDIVLRPGGSKPSLEILREFLGRAPNDEAFNKEHSLTM